MSQFHRFNVQQFHDSKRAIRAIKRYQFAHACLGNVSNSLTIARNFIGDAKQSGPNLAAATAIRMGSLFKNLNEFVCRLQNDCIDHACEGLYGADQAGPLMDNTVTMQHYCIDMLLLNITIPVVDEGVWDFDLPKNGPAFQPANVANPPRMPDFAPPRSDVKMEVVDPPRPVMSGSVRLRHRQRQAQKRTAPASPMEHPALKRRAPTVDYAETVSSDDDTDDDETDYEVSCINSMYEK